jgi:hypothetical protein
MDSFTSWFRLAVLEPPDGATHMPGEGATLSL